MKYKKLKKQTPHTRYIKIILFWLLQKKISTSTKDALTTKQELEKEKIGFNRIRCPLCEWRPSKFSRWVCSDCENPEYFYSACGTVWNTFTTQGLCPGCKHQWRWTSCLSCSQWSLHETWYEKQSC